ncbi:hypothetical protein ABK040_010949 [Willaertia magna]
MLQHNFTVNATELYESSTTSTPSSQTISTPTPNIYNVFYTDLERAIAHYHSTSSNDLKTREEQAIIYILDCFNKLDEIINYFSTTIKTDIEECLKEVSQEKIIYFRIYILILLHLIKVKELNFQTDLFEKEILNEITQFYKNIIPQTGYYLIGVSFSLLYNYTFYNKLLFKAKEYFKIASLLNYDLYYIKYVEIALKCMKEYINVYYSDEETLRKIDDLFNELLVGTCKLIPQTLNKDISNYLLTLNGVEFREKKKILQEYLEKLKIISKDGECDHFRQSTSEVLCQNQLEYVSQKKDEIPVTCFDVWFKSSGMLSTDIARFGFAFRKTMGTNPSLSIALRFRLLHLFSQLFNNENVIISFNRMSSTPYHPYTLDLSVISMVIHYFFKKEEFEIIDRNIVLSSLIDEFILRIEKVVESPLKYKCTLETRLNCYGLLSSLYGYLILLEPNNVSLVNDCKKAKDEADIKYKQLFERIRVKDETD